MFTTVVIGVSNDEAALDALALAKALSGDGTLTLVHVQVGNAEEASGAGDVARLPEPLVSLRDPSTGDDHPLVVVRGPSVRAGLHEATLRAGADLLVIGASRRSGLHRALGDDDTSAVLRDAPCAAAVAPPGYAAGDRTVRTLAVAYDGSMASDQALAVGRTLAADHHAKLAAVEVLAPPLFTGPLTTDIEITERMAAARERIDQLGGVEAHAEYGRTDLALARYAEQVDLLVLGPHDRADGGGPHRPALAPRLASRAPCALLVLPEPRHAMR